MPVRLVRLWGRFGGTVKDTPAVELGVVAMTEALKRAGVKPEEIDEVILGNVLQAGQGQNPARQVTINGGCPVEVVATTVNKVCASGLKTVAMAAQAINSDDADIVLAGGIENMSIAPFYVTKARWGARMGDTEMIDGMVFDGLFDIFNRYHMGITAENVAEKFGHHPRGTGCLCRGQPEQGRGRHQGRPVCRRNRPRGHSPAEKRPHYL